MDTTDFDDGDLTELDRLLNDPEVPMQASRVWELLEKVSHAAQRSPSQT